MKKDVGFLILLLVLLVNLSFRIWQYRQEYLTKFDSVYWQDRYFKSQWVNPQSKEPIGDDGLYAYAGWEYVHGKDPTLINAEMPLLGKYLIGLSIIIFANQNIFALVTGILVLFVFYKLNLLVIKERFWAFLPVVLFSFEPLYYQQLRAPYLDTLYLLFLFLTFYFLLKEKPLISAIFLGLMAATKNTVSTFILISATAMVYQAVRLNLFPHPREILKRVQNDKLLLKYLPISLLIVLLSYFRYFQLGHSLRDFLGVQKWILNFYAVGAKGTFGMVFPMLILNRWETWWNGIIKINEWQVTWPILFLFYIFYFIFSILRKKSDQFLLPLIWVLVYVIFLTFIPVWPRYFLLIIPFLYLLATHLVKDRFSNLMKNRTI